jgi:hypothetical protein
MKIDSEKVVELIKVVKAYVEGIEETIRIGDDGFQDSVINQKENLFKEINEWKAINLATKEQPEKHWSEKEIKDWTPAQLWANSLSAYLWRKIKSDTQIGDILNHKLFEYIEGYLNLPEAKSMNKTYYDVYVTIGIKTVQEIANKIVEERKKAPQQKLL